MAFRQVSFTRACTPGLEAPAPKTQVKAGKVEVVPSAVVYTRFCNGLEASPAACLGAPGPSPLEGHGLLGLVCGTVPGRHGPAAGVWQDQNSGKGRQHLDGYERPPGLLNLLGVCRWDPLAQNGCRSRKARLRLHIWLGASPWRLLWGWWPGRGSSANVLLMTRRFLWLVQIVPNEVTVEQLMGVLGCAFTDVEMVFQRRRGLH